MRFLILLVLLAWCLLSGLDLRSHLNRTVAADLLPASRNSPAMSVANIRQVLQHAVDSERSVVYVNMAWSLTSEFGKQEYARLVMDYHRQRPDDPLLFHLVDCTAITNDYSLLTGLPGWSDAVNSAGSPSTISGGGN